LEITEFSQSNDWRQTESLFEMPWRLSVAAQRFWVNFGSHPRQRMLASLEHFSPALA
jgi:hypothetical protein